MSETTQVEIHVTMPDGTVWAVPADLVAASCADYYAGRGMDRDAVFRETMADDYELADWATNNMNWDDVEGSARMVERRVDYQEGWVNGNKRIVRPEERERIAEGPHAVWMREYERRKLALTEAVWCCAEYDRTDDDGSYEALADAQEQAERALDEHFAALALRSPEAPGRDEGIDADGEDDLTLALWRAFGWACFADPSADRDRALLVLRARDRLVIANRRALSTPHPGGER